MQRPPGQLFSQTIHYYRFPSTAVPPVYQHMQRTCHDGSEQLARLRQIFWSIPGLKAALTMASRKRRDSGPVAAPAESKESASHMSGPSDEQATRCVASKADPKLWELAKSLPTEELETETNPVRRRNIEACLKYVNENGYPYPNEVFIAMDGVVKHVTERECEAMDWASLTDSGKRDEAFLMVS